MHSHLTQQCQELGPRKLLHPCYRFADTEIQITKAIDPELYCCILLCTIISVLCCALCGIGGQITYYIYYGRNVSVGHVAMLND